MSARRSRKTVATVTNLSKFRAYKEIFLLRFSSFQNTHSLDVGLVKKFQRFYPPKKILYISFIKLSMKKNEEKFSFFFARFFLTSFAVRFSKTRKSWLPFFKMKNKR